MRMFPSILLNSWAVNIVLILCKFSMKYEEEKMVIDLYKKFLYNPVIQMVFLLDVRKILPYCHFAHFQVESRVGRLDYVMKI